MNPLDELVEGAGHLAELVLRMNLQALGQVTFTLGDVLHGYTHDAQGAHQHLNQQAEQEDDADHCDHHGDDGRGAEGAEHGVGLGLVDAQADMPGHAWQAFDRGEGQQAGHAVQFDFAELLGDARGVFGEHVAQAFHHQVLVRVHQNLAVGADQEGVAHAVEVQGIDDLHQGLQAQVTADHARRLGRGGNGDDQLLGGGIDIGFGQGGAAGGHGVLVPRAGARVVVSRHVVVGAHGEAAVGAAQVAVDKGRGQGFLFQQAANSLRRRVASDGLRGAFHQEDASRQPALNVVGRDRAHFRHVAVQVTADGVALLIVAEQGEQREGSSDHQGGCKQDFLAKFQVHGNDRGYVC